MSSMPNNSVADSDPVPKAIGFFYSLCKKAALEIYLATGFFFVCNSWKLYFHINL